MLNKLRILQSLFKSHGSRWLLFRLGYALRIRTGFVRLQLPSYDWKERPLETWLKKNIPVKPEAYARWRNQNSPAFLFEGTKTHDKVPWNPQLAVNEAEQILNGEIKYFSHQFLKTGFPPDWYRDCFTSHVTLRGASRHSASLLQQSETLGSDASTSGFDTGWENYPSLRSPPLSAILPRSDIVKHWSQISDDSNCDIKFIWEPNRFSFVYTLVRAYAATQDEKYAEAFWGSILDWAEHNLPNTGTNWMDGQEIALRLMAWIFGYNAFLNPPPSTPERISQFTIFVAAQTERIHKNIDYAISTRSNHTISEAFGLWLVGLLFPELKDSEKYLSLGRKLLEQEAAIQISPDGSYSMYSLNYHRFILHIYLYAIRLGEINHSPFSTQLQNSIANSITYLSQLVDPQTGQMPVYGSNDGALVLPLNDCDFTDYRPLLQLGSYITKREFLFEPGAWDEDLFWLCGVSRAERSRSDSEGAVEAQVRKVPLTSFPHGGTYLLRNKNSKAILRCTDFRARPSHADQLHMDLWIHGRNIACDAGTYLYSGAGIWRNELAHTSVHNTVIVDNKDQMTMVSRFTWTDWAKGKVLEHDQNRWQGEHDGYKPVSHKRTVMMLETDRWLVVDHLVAEESHQYALHWLLNDYPFEQKENSVLLSLNGMKFKVQVSMAEGVGNFSLVRAHPTSTRGWRSRYYGHKEPALSVILESNQPRAIFWTFFGFENDVVEVDGKLLKIGSQVIDPDKIK